MLLVAGCSAPRGDQQIADGSATTSAFTEVWYAPDGDPAEHGEGRDRTFEVTARVGADHCDWQSVVFLSVAWPLGSTYQAGADAVPFRQYVRDREGRVSGPLVGDLELDARLPDDAVATGYRTERVELWLGPDRGDRHVYMRTDRGGPWSGDSIRRGRREINRRHASVLIRYNHARSELRPSNPGTPRQAPSNASCNASSASCTEPSIR